MSAPFPWQMEPWRRVQAAAAAERLGHALLLVGRSGLGKVAFARDFAKGVLCLGASGDAGCGECRSCMLFAVGNHPDFRELSPEEEGSPITVDQVRELTDCFALTSHFERGKIALIAPADAMNRAAANALLKCLEEPPPGALLMLVSNRLDGLPPTVRSRCHRLGFDGFDPAIAHEWVAQRLPDMTAADIVALLEQAAGAPLRALDLAGGGLESARRMVRLMQAVARGDLEAIDAARDPTGSDIETFVDTAMRVVHRLVLPRPRDVASRVRPDAPGEDMHMPLNQLDLKRLFRFFDVLLETRALLVTRASLRDADVAEGLWVGWSETVRRHGVEA